ncbi:Caskin-1 [Camelus dromedarius]|uniref:Caskin-1 n=1 Tax=Camelus dromedarius TaxID=9838 RepID=A0A5N4BZ38_CAMDR|nr:Caskin-1 [Camelus dromedarius]
MGKEQELVQAVKAEDVGTAQRLLQRPRPGRPLLGSTKKINVNSKTPDGPLHLAAKNGHIDIIRYGRVGRERDQCPCEKYLQPDSPGHRAHFTTSQASKEIKQLLRGAPGPSLPVAMLGVFGEQPPKSQRRHQGQMAQWNGRLNCTVSAEQRTRHCGGWDACLAVTRAGEPAAVLCLQSTEAVSMAATFPAKLYAPNFISAGYDLPTINRMTPEAHSDTRRLTKPPVSPKPFWLSLCQDPGPHHTCSKKVPLPGPGSPDMFDDLADQLDAMLE